MSATVVAEARDGRTRFTTLRSEPPISMRNTPEGLYLVASGAGPIGGDNLEVDLDVLRDASLAVRSAGASIVLPGPSNNPSSLRIRARVAASASLWWEPEPTILVAGCDHRVRTTIELAPGATLLWREVVILGRHEQPTGSLLQRLHIDRAGSPLLRTELPIGPRWIGAGGPAGTDGASAVSSLLVVGLDEPALPDEADGAVLRLAEDAWLVTVLSGRLRRPDPAIEGRGGSSLRSIAMPRGRDSSGCGPSEVVPRGG